MSISQNVKALLAQKSLTQKDLSVYLGVGTSTVNNWLKLNRSIPSEYIIPICEFVGVTSECLLTGKEKNISAELTEDEQELMGLYKELTEKHQICIIERARTLHELEQEDKKPQITVTHNNITLKHSVYRVSAGTGEMLYDSDEWNEIEVPNTPESRKADFCLTITGDSMEPVYYDGDIVLIKSQPYVNLGQIGIFIIEGSGYIKKFGGDRLISLNEEYDYIMFADYNSEDIRCSGLVIGRV